MRSPDKGSNASERAQPLHFLLLYGSLREDSNSRRLVTLAASTLQSLGARTTVFDPQGLPLPDGSNDNHPKVKELRALTQQADGYVWCSPEWHGTITGIFKNQVDWFPYQNEGYATLEWKTLAVMQLSGGVQSFNAVNSLRLLGRWMHLWCIPGQLSIGQSSRAFDAQGQLTDPSQRERLTNLIEELYGFSKLMRGRRMPASDPGDGDRFL